MTGAVQTWAVRYQPGNVVQYKIASKELCIERGSSATVLSTNARENTVTVQRGDGEAVTYARRGLHGVNVFQVTEREFTAGDRLQFTASSASAPEILSKVDASARTTPSPHVSTREKPLS